MTCIAFYPPLHPEEPPAGPGVLRDKKGRVGKFVKGSTMSNPSGFVDEYVAMDGDEYVSGFTFPETTPAGGYSIPFSTADVFRTQGGLSGYEPNEDIGTTEQDNFENNPYEDEYGNGQGEVDVGYESATTGMNTSATPNTQASTRTTSTSGSNAESRASKSQRRKNGHGSKSVTTPDAPPDAPAKKKAGRKASKSKTAGEEEEAKRNKFLERNRIAASKCRQKKKEWISGLEGQKAGLESHNSQLQQEYSGLLGEVGGLKEELMSHANCNDPKINQWIENEANRFVQGMSDRISRNDHGGSQSSRRPSTLSSSVMGGTSGRDYPNIEPLLGELSSPGLPLEEDTSFSPTEIGGAVYEDTARMFGTAD